jgi:hypothetical protein
MIAKRCATGESQFNVFGINQDQSHASPQNKNALPVRRAGYHFTLT